MRPAANATVGSPNCVLSCVSFTVAFFRALVAVCDEGDDRAVRLQADAVARHQCRILHADNDLAAAPVLLGPVCMMNLLTPRKKLEDASASSEYVRGRPN